EPGEEANRGLDVAIALGGQLLRIEISGEKAAKGLGIERPTQPCRIGRIGSNLRYARDRNQRDTARLENPRHGPQRRPNLEDELEHLREDHAIEGAIRYLWRIDQVGKDSSVTVVPTCVRYD